MVISQWLVISLIAFGLVSNLAVHVMRKYEEEDQSHDKEETDQSALN